MKNRILSFIVTISMVISLLAVLPTTANAAASGTTSSGGGGGSSASSSTATVNYKSYTFTGTISLPDNEIADEDIPVTISIRGCKQPDTSVGVASEALSGYTASDASSGVGGGSSSGAINTGNISGYSVYVPTYKTVIPQGKNSIRYTLTKNIEAFYSYGYAYAKIESDTYLQYSESDTILLDSAEENILDIELNKPECNISGTFTLGEDALALPDDMEIQLYLSDSEEFNYKYSYTIILPSGNNKVDFQLPARYGKYYLTYYAVAESNDQQHISDQWYDYEEMIDAETDVDGILLECRYGEVIEGVLKLPDGIVAPEGGVDISIGAGRTITVTIPEGQNSIDYTVAASQVIDFTQVNAGVHDVHYKKISKNTSTDDVSVIVLEPIYTVSGIVTFSEPVKDNEALIYVTVSGVEKSYSCIGYVDYTVGDITAEYCIELYNFNSKLSLGDVLDVSVNRDYSSGHLPYNEVAEKAIMISDYASIYDINIDLKNRAEIIKGTIHLPESFSDNRINVRAKSDNQRLSETVSVRQNADVVEFILKGDSENISDYNGDYELYLSCYTLSGYNMYYNQGSLSLDEASKIAVNGETVELEMSIPEENQHFKGVAVLPQVCSDDITVEVNMIEKDSLNYVGSRQFTIPAGAASAEFDLGYILKKTDYIVSYSINDKDVLPYNTNMELYLSENGCSASQEEAKVYVADGQVQSIDLNLEPLMCSSSIKGTIRIPDGIVPAYNTYFYVDITAECDERKETTTVRFNAGETEKDYSIIIPDLYREESWNLRYKIGTKTEIPSAPAKNELADTSFRRLSSSSGGSGGGGSGPHNIIPKEVIQGIDVYYSGDGITYDKTNAENILLNGTTVYNADITLGTTHNEHPRKIGGYFCDIYKDISATVQLYDINNGIVLDSVTLDTDSEYAFYELETYSLNDLVIKYIYDGKEEYYSKNRELTESIDEAMLISVQSDSVRYGFDVNKNNILYKDFNDRYFRYRIEGSRYSPDDVKIILYDLNGNVLQSATGEYGDLDMDTAEVYIGFEFSGKKYYFAGKPGYSYYGPKLNYVVENIDRAYPYIIPHRSYSVNVVIDMSDYTSGISVGDDNAAINEAYFNYSETEAGTYIESLYLDTTDMMFEKGKTIYLAFYGNNEQLLGLKTITEKPIGNIVPVNYLMNKGGYIKIFGWNSDLKPMLNAIEFFCEQK